MINSDKFIIGNWTVDPALNIVEFAEHTIKLEPQTMALLCYLAQHPNKPCAKDELIEQVWSGKVVGDHVVYKTINQLRKALSKDSSQEYIKTVPKKGYLLLAKVELDKVELDKVEAIGELDSETSSQSDDEQEVNTSSSDNDSWIKTNSGHSKGAWSKWLIGGFATLLIAILGWKFYLAEKWFLLTYPYYTKVSFLSDTQGIKYTPDVSPNGRFVLYSYNEKNLKEPRQLFVYDINTAQVTQLTNDSSDYYLARWSSSGRYITVSKRSSNDQVAKNCQLELLSFDPEQISVTEQRPITKCSRSGSYSYFHDRDNKLYYSFRENPDFAAYLFSIDVNTGKQEQLTFNAEVNSGGDGFFALSPDKSKIAYLRDTDWTFESLWLYDIKDKTSTMQYDFGWPIGTMTWTKDSEHVIYSIASEELAVLSLKHKTKRSIASSVTEMEFPVFLPEQDKILVVSGASSTDILSIANPLYYPDARYENFITSSEVDWMASFSPSDRVAFVSRRSGLNQIWLRGQDGKERQLSKFDKSRLILHLEWSPDESKILSDYKGIIYYIDVETGQETVVFDKQKNDQIYAGNAVWAPDGTSIYFSGSVNDDWQIYHYDLKTQQLEQFTFNGGLDLQVSPNGKYLYYLKYYTKGIWRKSLAGGEEELVVESAGQETEYAWQAFDNGVYYFSENLEPQGLYHYDFATQDNKLVFRYPSHYPYFDISKDQQQIIFTSRTVFESSIKLLEVSK
ncbi:MAG: winged helix-turn-helix domain-containing protein [Kangiellaceae bacterium]|nr:winged helix-turn-helix domain-containing protein [Kangiellaceae bacterium]